MLVAAPMPVWKEAESFLFADGRERFGFFLCGIANTTTGPRFCVQEFRPIDDGSVETGPGIERRVELDALLEVINEAKHDEQALIEVHTHPLARTRVTFSDLDEEAMPEFAAYVLDALNGRPYGALVMGRASVDGRYWTEPPRFRSISRIAIVGETLELRVPTSSDLTFDPALFDANRYDRQIQLFGNPGQEQLAQFTVGVVGAGGTGSHVIQQLGYLGVRNYRIVDPDVVEESNLNRTIGATPSDVGLPKVTVAERVIEEIAAGDAVDITTVQQDLQTERAIRTLLEADLVFGCSDNDGARQVLNELARVANLPYIDLGSGVQITDGIPTELGGRVTVVHPDGPCLHCMDEIDRSEARYFLKPRHERERDRDAAYVNAEWAVPNPAVVSLNGAIASQAVNEFFLYSTGIDSVSPLFYYYAREAATPSQRCAPRRVKRDPTCYTCSLAGLGNHPGLERYILG